MGGIRKRLESYPEVSFIENTGFEELQSRMINDYQKKYRELTGQDIVLAAADPVRLMLYSCAVMIYQGYQYEDRAGKMGLLKYSTGAFLDAMAALKNVKRSPAARAKTTLKFTLAAALQTTAYIPAKTRIKAGENLYFETMEQAEIPAGETEAEAAAECQKSGEAGNGFGPGELKTLVDLLSYNLSVTNTTKTSGGAEVESDDDLAERIYLAPSAYSTAGPADAYKYWVKTYSQLIGDSLIKSASPGEVTIYPLLNDGTIPERDFLDRLEAYLQDSRMRPLTDHVTVCAPETLEYDIDGIFYISDREAEGEILKQVEQAVKNYVEWQKGTIGRDLNPSYLTYLLMEAGVKWVDLKKPVFTVIPDTSVAAAGNINLVYGGVQDD